MRRRNYNSGHNIDQIQTPPNFPNSNIPIPHPSNLHETRLRDEVLYLHSLWHRGPPSLFKRPKISDKEWPVPVESKPTSASAAWPQFKAVSKPVCRPATDEERGRLLGLKIHLKGLDLCSGLLPGGGEDEDEDEDEDEVCDDAQEYEFLMKVFEENGDLRDFYLKNCQGGDFYCLVCGVLGNQLRKKYKNCVALVQHCVTISRTKKKAAHRALGGVICKLLAWDVNRLPSFPVGSSSEIEGKNNADENVTDENPALKTDEGLKMDDVHQNSENVELEKYIPSVVSGESLDCRASFTGDASEGESKELNSG